MRKNSGRLGLVAVALAFMLAASACNYDWTGFGYDAGHSNATPDTGISINTVGGLAQAWTANMGDLMEAEPVVSKGVVYVVTYGGEVEAFDATGATGCGGTPMTCAPLWTAAVGGTVSNTPAIVDGQIVVMTETGTLAAFDAAGVTNCTQSTNGPTLGQTTCTPLWTATNPAHDSGSFVVDGGQIFTAGAYGPIPNSDGALAVYDAAGVDGCSGTPKTCSPLWVGTAPLRSLSPAAAGGDVYAIGDNGSVIAYAEDGSNCPGTPGVCAPLWSGPAGSPWVSPAVVGGDVYATSTGMTIFDAAGVDGCDATTTTCQALWTDATGGPDYGSPSISRGTAVVGVSPTGTGSGLVAFDAAGSNGCSGTPTVCSPLWGSDPALGQGSYTSIANGVVFVAMANGIDAFDLAGSDSCSGTPVICSPLWSAPGTGFRRSVVAQGTLYAATSDGILHVYKPTP